MSVLRAAYRPVAVQPKPLPTVDGFRDRIPCRLKTGAEEDTDTFLVIDLYSRFNAGYVPSDDRLRRTKYHRVTISRLLCNRPSWKLALPHFRSPATICRPLYRVSHLPFSLYGGGRSGGFTSACEEQSVTTNSLLGRGDPGRVVLVRSYVLHGRARGRVLRNPSQALVSSSTSVLL
jgi:hypothetical protein